MRNAAIFAVLSALAYLAAIGLVCQAEVPQNVPGYRYDLGQRQIPEGKADTLVVYSAVWCGPCQVLKPLWASLRLDDYKVVYVDVDDPHKHDGDWDYQTPELIEKVSKYRPDAVPTIRWYNSESEEFLDGKITGITTRAKVKEYLWKPSS